MNKIKQWLSSLSYRTGIIVVGLAMSSTFAMSAGIPKVIAHRGHWTPVGAAQNSVRSLIKADSINCYGSEFDVWLTSDNQLVVNHDRKMQGLVLEEAPADSATRIILSNGENLPFLNTYLDSAKATTLKLICEIKNHSTPQRDKTAAKNTIDMIKAKGLETRTEYITFSKDALTELIDYAPKGTPVYYLNGDLSPLELKNLGAAGADYNIKVFKKNPEWIEEAHKLGLKVNVWTVDDEADFQWCIDHGVDFITTNRPERLFRYLY